MWFFLCARVCVCAGHREYHVQFFGSVAERAWIHEKRIVIYQGKQQFEELQAETLRKATNPVEKQKVCTQTPSICVFMVLYSDFKIEKHPGGKLNSCHKRATA